MKKEFTIRAGKKVLDAAKGTPMESQVRKSVKKAYKEAGIGKPKGSAKTGKQANARISLAAGTPYKKAAKSGFKKGLKEGAKALKDMFKSGKK